MTEHGPAHQTKTQFEEIIAENFPNMGKEIVKKKKKKKKKVLEVQSPRQDKPKKEHTKIHSESN